MTDQEPVQDALFEAAASLVRIAGVMLLIIVVPTVLFMGTIWMLFFDFGP
ncbi:hypothetical protein ABZ446_03860 [Streptomyces sp. NPDC005813]